MENSEASNLAQHVTHAEVKIIYVKDKNLLT